MTEPTTEMKKWLYPAMKEVSEQLYKRFTSVYCEFQAFTEKKVIEQYSCRYKNIDKVISIIVIYSKFESISRVQILIHELKYIQGWQIEIK